jgi:hypothetical protein
MPYGVNTPWHPRGCRFTLQAMKTNCRRRHLTFGEFIMAVYDAYGKKAGGIVRLAVNVRLVEFQGHDRFVILEPGSDKNISFL